MKYILLFEQNSNSFKQKNNSFKKIKIQSNINALNVVANR